MVSRGEVFMPRKGFGAVFVGGLASPSLLFFLSAFMCHGFLLATVPHCNIQGRPFIYFAEVIYVVTNGHREYPMQRAK